MAGERALLQGRQYMQHLTAADLDGMWNGTFIDPSANTVGHACLSVPCRNQFEKGMFKMSIIDGGTKVDWVDVEIGGNPKNPDACEADGLHNITRPSGIEMVRGSIQSYEDMRLLVSVSPREFLHNTISREGLIVVDPFIWCMKLKVFVSKGKVKAMLHLFEDDYIGTRDGWIEAKKNAENFKCHDVDLNPKTCTYDFIDERNVTVQRSEIVNLECVSGACLNIANSR
ncbi:unnamed protein product [Ostreobium quekettii]|uniref:Uncharacterized protein n=1 Tax=Ostreobium quekettii TaxID=121088 RepID=A0A8S1J867_9CHLO|nr:unnamed protein product [Ostreobium quekettii]